MISRLSTKQVKVISLTSILNMILICFLWLNQPSEIYASQSSTSYNILRSSKVESLNVFKSSDSKSVIVGEEFTYTIEVQNSTEVTATNLVLIDNLPEGVEHVSGGSHTEGQVQWEIAELAPDQSKTEMVTVKLLEDTALEEIVNDDYSVTADDEFEGIGTVPVTIMVRVPDLEISKSGPSQVQSGEVFEYELTIENVGDATAFDLVIMDTIDPNLSVVSITQDGEYDENDNSIMWTVDELVAGATTKVFANVSYTLKDSISTNIEDNEYEVSYLRLASDDGGSFRFQNSNNSQNIPTYIYKPLLNITKTSSVESINVGQPFDFDIEVKNPTEVPVFNLILKDVLPEGVEYVSGGSFEGGQVQWEIAELAPSQSKTETVSVKVLEDTMLEEIVNDDYSVTADNEFAGVGVEAVAIEVNLPDLQISKSGPSQVQSGEVFEYELKIENIGDATAYELIITDFLDENLEIVTEDENDEVPDTNEITWETDTLLPAEIISFSIQVVATLNNSDPLTIEDGDYGVTYERVNTGGNIRFQNSNIPDSVTTVVSINKLFLPILVTAPLPEPTGDSCEDAIPVEINETYSGFDSEDENDWYKFNLEEPLEDSRLEIMVSSLEGNGQLVLYKGQCENREVVKNDGSNSGSTRTINVTREELGTGTFFVRLFLVEFSDSGTYRLSLKTAP